MKSVDALVLAIRADAVREIAEIITHDADALEAGRRAMTLAYLLRPEKFKSQRDLAKRMSLTEARVSQRLKSLRKWAANHIDKSALS